MAPFLVDLTTILCDNGLTVKQEHQHMIKSSTTDLSLCHEDDLDALIQSFNVTSGQKPLYLFYSEDDETYFVSLFPIDIQRIQSEFPHADLCIVQNW